MATVTGPGAGLVAAVDALTFLEVWSHAGTFGDGWIEIATLPPRKLSFSRTAKDATERAMAVANGFRVSTYFALHPRAANQGNGGYGTGLDEDVQGYAGLAVDLDLHGRNQKHESKKGALDLIRSKLPNELQPALLWDSGYGIWAGWPFRELLSVEEAAAYVEMGLRLAHLLGGDTSVYTKRQLARLPGTVNWRSPNTPVAAKLLAAEPLKRFNLIDFDKWLPDLPPDAVRPRPTAVRPGSGHRAHQLAAPVQLAIAALGLDVDPITDRRCGLLKAVRILGPCPACHVDHEQKAWITPGGRLKCWRSTCRAGIDNAGASDDGRTRGLALHDWAPPEAAPEALELEPTLAREDPSTSAPVEIAAADRPDAELTLVEAQARVVADIDKAMAFASAKPGNIVAVAPPCAVGKTKAALKKQLRGGGGIFLVPSNPLLDEHVATAEGLQVGKVHRRDSVLRVLAADGSIACRYAAELKSWTDNGFSIRTKVCPSCPDQDNYMGSHTPCPAHQGNGGRGTTMAVHAMAPTIAATRQARVTVVVFDEMPAWLSVLSITMRQLHQIVDWSTRVGTGDDPVMVAWCAERAPFVRILLYAAKILRGQWKKEPERYARRVSGLELYALLRSAAAEEAAVGQLSLPMSRKRHLDTLLDLAVAKVAFAHEAAPTVPAPSGDAMRRGGPEAHDRLLPINVDEVLLSLIAEGDETSTEAPPTSNACMVVSGAGVSVEWRLKVPDITNKNGDPISRVILDATAPQMLPVMKAVWPHSEIRLLDFAVRHPPSVERVHLVTSSTIRKSLLDATSRRLSDRGANALCRVLWDACRLIAETGIEAGNIGIITHAPVATELRSLAKCLGQDASDRDRQRLNPGLQRIVATLVELRQSRLLGEFTVLHYGGQRGSNTMSKVDGLLLIGAPWPDIGATQEDARLVGLSNDAMVAALLRAELVQAEGRGRGIRRTPERPLVVVYAAKDMPKHWQTGEVKVRKMALGGANPKTGTRAAIVVASALSQRWGAFSASLARLLANNPILIAPLDRAAATATKYDSLSSSYCRALLPEPVLWSELAQLPDRTLRHAVEGALSDLPIVKTKAPLSARKGGAWTWRETVPGAAHALVVALAAIVSTAGDIPGAGAEVGSI